MPDPPRHQSPRAGLPSTGNGTPCPHRHPADRETVREAVCEENCRDIGNQHAGGRACDQENPDFKAGREGRATQLRWVADFGESRHRGGSQECAIGGRGLLPSVIKTLSSPIG